jgi:hypothetical protein
MWLLRLVGWALELVWLCSRAGTLYTELSVSSGEWCVYGRATAPPKGVRIPKAVKNLELNNGKGM